MNEWTSSGAQGRGVCGPFLTNGDPFPPPNLSSAARKTRLTVQSEEWDTTHEIL